jgi:hypothetical protein
MIEEKHQEMQKAHLSHRSRLMVASNELDTVRISKLEACEKGYRFNTKESSVYVVTEEQVVGVWGVTTYTEYFYEIIKLAVYVTDHCHRGTDMYDVRFSHENFLCFFAYFP